MLLPQSSAFAALKNRLNSVSSIGFLHIAPRPYVPLGGVPGAHSRRSSAVETHSLLAIPAPHKNNMETHTLTRSNATTPSGSNFDRPNRLKGREDGIIRWNELLEKFRAVQERARRLQRLGGDVDDGSSLGVGDLRINDGGLESRGGKELSARAPPVPIKDPPPTPPTKPRSGLGRQFGRLGGAVAGRGKRAQQ
jgi:vacuole morphology and inheritance protein 14